MNEYFKLRRSQLPKLRSKLEEARQLLVTLEANPMNHVERSRLHHSIERYYQAILDIDTGRLEKNYERKIKPFLEANRVVLFQDERPARKRHKGTGDALLAAKRHKNQPALIPGTQSARGRDQHGEIGVTKREMLEEYLTLFEGSVAMPEIEVDEMCHLCQQPMVVVDQKAQATCTRCGACRFYIDSTTANMQYNHELEFSSFSYKRVNHFNDWLAQIQARENNAVSDEVLRLVIDELLRRRISSPDEITLPLVRDVLKKLRLRKAYEHVTQIVCRLTGQPSPRLHPHLEECCRIMFIQIQPSFEKHKGNRKNMLSYSYTLFKFLQLLGVENVPMLHFQLLRGREKLQVQDVIFAKISAELDWEFIPSTPHAR
uniref:Uncharacterized protein n=1 Tax=viral metagenome TaxID=1070528 RepID=A0A6C0KDT9_9ZZZZ